MRMLPAVVIAGACALGTYVSAQDTPSSSKPVYTSEAMLKRIQAGGAQTKICVLPDKTERAVNTSVVVDGRLYRCVEVFDQNLQPAGAAWTRVDPQF